MFWYKESCVESSRTESATACKENDIIQNVPTDTDVAMEVGKCRQPSRCRNWCRHACNGRGPSATVRTRTALKQAPTNLESNTVRTHSASSRHGTICFERKPRAYNTARDIEADVISFTRMVIYRTNGLYAINGTSLDGQRSEPSHPLNEQLYHRPRASQMAEVTYTCATT